MSCLGCWVFHKIDNTQNQPKCLSANVTLKNGQAESTDWHGELSENSNKNADLIEEIVIDDAGIAIFFQRLII